MVCEVSDRLPPAEGRFCRSERIESVLVHHARIGHLPDGGVGGRDLLDVTRFDRPDVIATHGDRAYQTSHPEETVCVEFDREGKQTIRRTSGQAPLEVWVTVAETVARLT